MCPSPYAFYFMHYKFFRLLFYFVELDRAKFEKHYHNLITGSKFSVVLYLELKAKY
jgi:hypothetical protein